MDKSRYSIFKYRHRQSVSFTPGQQTSLPANILGVFDGQYTYAVYFALDSNKNACTPQYEMYDRASDPDEIDNLLHAAPTEANLALAKQLHAKLTGLLKANGGTPGGWSALPEWQIWAPNG